VNNECVRVCKCVQGLCGREITRSDLALSKVLQALNAACRLRAISVVFCCSTTQNPKLAPPNLLKTAVRDLEAFLVTLEFSFKVLTDLEGHR
jgi:hypothetical protein